MKNFISIIFIIGMLLGISAGDVIAEEMPVLAMAPPSASAAAQVATLAEGIFGRISLDLRRLKSMML